MRQVVENVFKFAPSRQCAIPTKSYRCLADLFDDAEDIIALLLLDDVTKEPPDKANVLTHGVVAYHFLSVQGTSSGPNPEHLPGSPTRSMASFCANGNVKHQLCQSEDT